MEITPALQAALDAVPCAAVAVDAGHRIFLINKHAENLLGLLRPAVLGRTLPDVDALAPLTPLLTGGAFTGREVLLTAAGLPAAVAVDAAPLPGGDGSPAGTLIIIREAHDLPDGGRLIEHLESLAGIGEIAAGAIHEIRNPLTAISGFIQLMRARALRQADQTTQDYCTLIAEEINHINGILSDFLTLARTRETKLGAVDISRLIRDVQSLMYGEALLSGITFLVRLPGEPLLIHGNADKIKEVLVNLSRNAFQAMSGGGTLTITAGADEKTVHIALADTGQGMPPAVLAEIFKPFYTTKESGTGLGLAICRRIVAEHRGEITVSSDEGKGATFILTFPKLEN